MADSDQTPEALKRLCDRLNGLSEHDHPELAIGTEAADAIATLMGERDTLVKACHIAASVIADLRRAEHQLTERAEQAEVALREVAEIAETQATEAEAMADADYNSLGISKIMRCIATIARTGQGGEGS